MRPSLPLRCIAEPLERRALLAASLGASCDDGAAQQTDLSPAAPAHVTGEVMALAAGRAQAEDLQLAPRFRGKPLVKGGRFYRFKVTYPGGTGTDRPSAPELTVSGPGSFSWGAELRKVTRSPDGRRATARYRLPGPGGRFDGADDGEYTVRTSDGTVLGTFRVDAPPLPVPRSEITQTFSAELTSVYAWCDHMPWIGTDDPPREYLRLEAVLKNTGDAPLEVSLDQCLVSFDPDDPGTPTDAVSFAGPDGRLPGGGTVVLQPGETRTVTLGGNGVYPEGNHGRELYVTLAFSSPAGAATVRDSGSIFVTY